MHELRQQFLQFMKYCETILRDENAAGTVKETVSFFWFKQLSFAVLLLLLIFTAHCMCVFVTAGCQCSQ